MKNYLKLNNEQNVEKYQVLAQPNTYWSFKQQMCKNYYKKEET